MSIHRKFPALIIVVLALGFFVSGCATTQTADDPAVSFDESAQTPSWAENYIARVNQQARQRGVRVRWVNPPRERDRRRTQEDSQN